MVNDGQSLSTTSGEDAQPEAAVEIILTPPETPDIRTFIYKLKESPRVRKLMDDLGIPSDCPANFCFSIIIDGAFYGKKFKDYKAELFGLQVMATSVEELYPCRSFVYSTLIPETDPILLWRQRVFYQGENVWTPSLNNVLSPTSPQEPFLELKWHPLQRVQPMDLLNIAHAPTNIGIALLKYGKQLLSEIEAVSSGRPTDSGLVTGANKEQAFNFILKKAKGIYSSSGQVTKHQVARACGGNFGISARDDKCNIKCAGCQAIDRLIKQCNSKWTWKRNVLPQIKTP